MKKIFLYCLSISLLATGCTTKEQDEKIEAFWQQQKAELFSQRLSMAPGEPFPPIIEEAPADEMPSSEENALVSEPASDLNETQNPPIESSAPLAQKELPVPVPPTQNNQVPAKQTKLLNAYLITSSSSPWCQKLKQEKWPEVFSNKYQGKIRLIEYDISTPQGQAGFTKILRRYNRSSIATPSLFIGGFVVEGYPLAQADAVVQKVLARQSKKVSRQPSSQFMEIIMEDSPKAHRVNTRASERDRRAMQLALATVERNNQALLADVKYLFGEDTQGQAFAIVARTERLLKNKAASSPNYQTYLTTQKALLQVQEKELNQLMRQNAKNIRAIRG